jgi:CxxC-x17-CxxC domain-containing protein
MELQDKSLTCTDCGAGFVFSAGEQRFFQEKGFSHEPRRCKDCRERKKGDGAGARQGGPARGGGYARSNEGGRQNGNARQEGNGRQGGARIQGGEAGGGKRFFSGVCSQCGAPATRLTFEPSPDRPVYCRTCHQARNSERSYR